MIVDTKEINDIDTTRDEAGVHVEALMMGDDKKNQDGPEVGQRGKMKYASRTATMP